MTAKQWSFALCGLIFCGLAAFGAAHLSLGLGTGPDLATAVGIAVGCGAIVLVDARSLA